MGRLKNKVAVITGAASGIGKATAELFVREGANVVLTDLNNSALEELAAILGRNGNGVNTISGDVSRESTAEKIAECVRLNFRQVDVILNSAGIDLLAPLLSTSAEQWDKILAVNLKSIFLICKHLVPLMQNGGAIVNIASATGLVPVANRPAYNTSKGAVVALTKSLALDLAPKIRVNCICPGAVETPLLRSAIEATPDPEATRAAIKARYPIGRIADVQEIASVIAFLASDEASYITGATIPVDGGRTMH